MGRRDLQARRRSADESAVAAGFHSTADDALGAVARRVSDDATNRRSDKPQAAQEMILARGEFHTFKGDGADYLYLVPSAAVVKLDDATRAVLDALNDGHRQAADVAAQLEPRFPTEDVRSAITELLTVRAIQSVTA